MCIIGPSDTFCVTTLARKIFIAILVMFFSLLKTSAFSFGNIFVKLYSSFTIIFETVIPDNYYSDADVGNQLKVRPNAMEQDDASR